MIRAYYYAPPDLITPRTGEPIRVGETVSVECEPVLCGQGLHASRRALDAIRYQGRGCLTIVEIGGVVVEGHDKIAGQTRKTVAILDEAASNRLLRLFACDVAEELIAEAKRLDLAYQPDPRSLAAIAVARRYAVGEATRGELDAAEAAARAAADAEARAGARVAAWASAAVTWVAGASAAARAAAWAVVWVAAEAAAEAAGEAAWARLADRLEQMIDEAVAATTAEVK